MARLKEIENFALMSYKNIARKIDYADTETAAFEGIIKGAKWSDKTMIDKVCEWLDMNLNDYISEGSREGISREKREELFKDLRKDMEI